MRILVTGACGFVGGYLVKILHERGHEVVAAVQNASCQFSKPVRTVTFDITNANETADIITTIRPDVIINLAAQSMVVKAWEDPQTTFVVNVLGPLNICEALRSRLPNCRLINIGSSEEYGLTAMHRTSLREEEACLPQNPYSLSKFSAGQLLMQMANKHGLQVTHLRPFNHFGPGQHTGYAISDFASQIAQIEKGVAPAEIVVGDVDVYRDFTDVRDIVDGYALIAETEIIPGIYNLCSGVARRVGAVLEQMVQQSTASIQVRVDREKFRASEVPFFVGSADKITQATGWVTQREFKKSLRETLDWWRKR